MGDTHQLILSGITRNIPSETLREASLSSFTLLWILTNSVSMRLPWPWANSVAQAGGLCRGEAGLPILLSHSRYVLPRDPWAGDSLSLRCSTRDVRAAFLPLLQVLAEITSSGDVFPNAQVQMETSLDPHAGVSDYPFPTLCHLSPSNIRHFICVCIYIYTHKYNLCMHTYICTNMYTAVHTLYV